MVMMDSMHKCGNINMTKKMNFAQAVAFLFKTFSDDKKLYLVMSKKEFTGLVFVIGAGLTANIAMIDLMIHGAAEHVSIYILATQFAVSCITIALGIRLLFKGINIITGDDINI